MMQFRQCVRFAWLKQVKIAWLLSISSVGLADEIVSLKDGREVCIRDNYTWEYMQRAAPVSRNASEDFETRKSLAVGLDEMQFAFKRRYQDLILAWYQVANGHDPNAVELKVVYDKIRTNRMKATPIYEDCHFRLRSDQKAQELLTEFYLYWKSSMDQVTISRDESIKLFELKMRERVTGLQERKDRLALAVSYLTPKGAGPIKRTDAEQAKSASHPLE